MSFDPSKLRTVIDDPSPPEEEMHSAPDADRKPVSADDLANGLNRDWAELLSALKYKVIRTSTSELANEKELSLAIRAMNARHKIRVNSAILKMKNSNMRAP